MKIMIHACNKRMHYVNGFLIPWLTGHGIREEDLQVWVDAKQAGCLKAYIASYKSLPEDGDTWHMEDDVLPGKAFFRTAPDLENIPGIMCGFGSLAYCRSMHPGLVYSPKEMYYSFPCIRIPNRQIKMFLSWFEMAARQQRYADYVEQNKHTDYLFRHFLDEVAADTRIYNLNPCLVEHVDEYVGGSTINGNRDEIAKALAFDDPEAMAALEEWRRK